MHQKILLKRFFLINVVLAFVFFCSGAVSAQVSDVIVTKQKAKTVIKPKAKPVASKVDVTRKVTIVRVDKKNRTTYKKQTTVTKSKKTAKTAQTNLPPSARKIQVPLMAIQLRLLKVNEDGSVKEADPLSNFSTQDRLRLSVKTNQRGYLYIIRQRSPEEDGEIIFPTLLANNASNYVAANYEYVLPFNCPKQAVPIARDCSLQLFPLRESPQEYFTLIFTRDSLIGLPSDAKSERGSIVNLMSAGKLKSETLIDLIEDSNQDLISQRGDTDFAVRIVNINAKDNEEIIETFVLNKE